LGQIPGSGGSARLQKMIGITRSKDVVMRSKRISGRQAFDWGVVSECDADARLAAATDALGDGLIHLSPVTPRTPKKPLHDSQDGGEATLSLGIELEGQCYGRLRQSDDFKEGVEAFHAKRRPSFRGT